MFIKCNICDFFSTNCNHKSYLGIQKNTFCLPFTTLQGHTMTLIASMQTWKFMLQLREHSLRLSILINHCSLTWTTKLDRAISIFTICYPNTLCVGPLHLEANDTIHLLNYVSTILNSRNFTHSYLFLLWVYSFWAKSIVRWGENGRSPRKTTWPPRKHNLACLTCDQREAQTHSGEMMSDLEC